MSGKGILIGLVFTFGCGYALASNTAAQPVEKVETKVIRVPEVITHVETKEINVPQKLPDSCLLLATKLQAVAGTLSTASGSVGAVSDAMSDAAVSLETQDPAARVKAVEKLTTNQEAFTDAAVGIASSNDQIKPMLEQCKKDSQPHD